MLVCVCYFTPRQGGALLRCPAQGGNTSERSARGILGTRCEPGGELLDDPPAGEVDQLVADMDALAASRDDASLMQDGELLGYALLAHREASRKCADGGAAPFVEDFDQSNPGGIAQHFQHRRDHLDGVLGQWIALYRCGCLLSLTIGHLTTTGREG